MPENAELPPRPEVIPAWATLSADEKRLYARMQEVFAGAVEYADAQFGRVLDTLDGMGMTDNTIVIVTSDNGASGEGGLFGTANALRMANDLPAELDLRAIDALGGPQAYSHYPAGWALAGNTPGQYWEQTVREGGVRDPFVISWPKGISARGEIRSQFVHAIDVAPTLLELVGVDMPDTVEGSRQMPLEGESFAPTLESATVPSTRDKQYFEAFGNRGIWAKGWKAVSFHGRWPWDTTTSDPDFDHDPWHLYNLDIDPNETVDLAPMLPEKLKELQTLFEQQARAHDVFPLDDASTEHVGRDVERLLGNRSEFVYDGVTRATPEVLSPPVKNRSHSIVAEVRVPEGGAEGVLATCGGRFGGYALYLKDGKLTYVHNFVGDESYVIESKRTVKPGERQLRFSFEKSGENSGTGRLYIDGVLERELEIPRTVPKLYSPNESFDTGLDTGTAAGDYDVPFEFTGRLRRVTVTLDEDRGRRGGSKTYGASTMHD